MDFGTGGISTLTASAGVDNAYAGKQIEIRLDSTSGTLLGTFTFTGTGGWDVYTTQSCAVSSTTGTHTLYLVCKGTGQGFGNIDWFKFIQ